MGVAFRRCAAARRPPATICDPCGTRCIHHNRNVLAPNAGAGPKARRFALPRPTAWEHIAARHREGQRSGDLFADRSERSKLPGRWPYRSDTAIAIPRPLGWARQIAGASPRQTKPGSKHSGGQWTAKRPQKVAGGLSVANTTGKRIAKSNAAPERGAYRSAIPSGASRVWASCSGGTPRRGDLRLPSAIPAGFGAFHIFADSKWRLDHPVERFARIYPWRKGRTGGQKFPTRELSH